MTTKSSIPLMQILLETQHANAKLSFVDQNKKRILEIRVDDECADILETIERIKKSIHREFNTKLANRDAP